MKVSAGGASIGQREVTRYNFSVGFCRPALTNAPIASATQSLAQNDTLCYFGSVCMESGATDRALNHGNDCSGVLAYTRR